jgi:hypothetical protein
MSVLTAAEIGQMRQVPDLVFLNCCHLAQVGPEARDGSPVAYNRLAASISRELIEMGVRAVVAAGWAVRDDAANFFARVFYDEMLAGATFGAALCTRERPGSSSRLQYLKAHSLRRSGLDLLWHRCRAPPASRLGRPQELHDLERGPDRETLTKLLRLLRFGSSAATLVHRHGIRQGRRVRRATEYLQKALESKTPNAKSRCGWSSSRQFRRRAGAISRASRR